MAALPLCMARLSLWKVWRTTAESSSPCALAMAPATCLISLTPCFEKPPMFCQCQCQCHYYRPHCDSSNSLSGHCDVITAATNSLPSGGRWEQSPNLPVWRWEQNAEISNICARTTHKQTNTNIFCREPMIVAFFVSKFSNLSYLHHSIKDDRTLLPEPMQRSGVSTNETRNADVGGRM